MKKADVLPPASDDQAGSSRASGEGVPASDEEVICAFMEPKPDLTLDGLHKLEERLTEEQRRHYCVLIFQWNCHEARSSNLIEDTLTKNRWPMIHASAEQKIKALAAVLRGESL